MEIWKHISRHKMKTYRCSVTPVRLVIFVWQLSLILRTKAQTPASCIGHVTYRPPKNSDITVVCGTEYMDLSIYLCPMYQALYNESMMVANNEYNNPECFGAADWSVDPPVLKFRFPLLENSSLSCNNNFKIIDEVGNGLFSDFSNVQYVNISGVVNSLGAYSNMITYRSQITYKFSCFYPMQYLLNNTEVAVSGVNLAIRDNNGSFISTLSMHLYKDADYTELLTIPQKGLNLKTKIYVAVKATNLTDRFNVLLDRCYTTTDPHPMFNTYYDLFVGCTRDAQTKVELNGASQTALFSFEAFRFVEHKNRPVSVFYLHCITRLCEPSTCSSLMPDCGSSVRRRRRETQYVTDSATITSPAIHVALPSAGVTDRLTTDIPSYYQTAKYPKYKTYSPDDSVLVSASSLSCNSLPVVAASVCSVFLAAINI